MKGGLLLATLLVVAFVAVPSSSGNRLELQGVGSPLVGADLIQHLFSGPYCWGGHIILDYNQPGVRAEMQDDLAAMRAAGLQTFRLFLYNEHGGDPSHAAISSSDGRIPEPYRTNLINFLTDIRKADFLQVTLAFNPWGTNDPTSAFDPDRLGYNPSLFEENWSFIRDVRPLLKQYGPPSTQIDLINEGAPSDYLSGQVKQYIAALYARYVEAFGADDVSVSVIDKGESNAGNTDDDSVRMQNLIDALHASGKPMPHWFDVHPSWDVRLIEDLRAVDRVLRDNGIAAALVIGEEKYNDSAVAAAIANFTQTSSRPIAAVMEWPYILDGGVQPRCPHPPYRVDAYAAALQGSAPSTTLRARVGPGQSISLTTANGDPVTALEAGTYMLTIRDLSRKDDFHLVGRGVNVRTGLAQRALKSVTIILQGETRYVYKSDRRRSKLVGGFNVITPG